MHKCLLDAAKTASATDKDVILRLLSPLADESTTTKHCVRCHQSYSESTNGPRACKIEHNYTDSEQDGRDVDLYWVTLSCCGERYNAEYEPKRRFCIEVPHTTGMEGIDYWRGEDDDRPRINEQIITCAEKGCKKSKKRSSTEKGSSSAKRTKVRPSA